MAEEFSEQLGVMVGGVMSLQRAGWAMKAASNGLCQVNFA